MYQFPTNHLLGRANVQKQIKVFANKKVRWDINAAGHKYDSGTVTSRSRKSWRELVMA
jgi:hypothetical protein